MSISSIGTVQFNKTMLDQARPRNLADVAAGSQVTVVEINAVEVHVDQPSTDIQKEQQMDSAGATVVEPKKGQVYAAVATAEPVPAAGEKKL